MKKVQGGKKIHKHVWLSKTWTNKLKKNEVTSFTWCEKCGEVTVHFGLYGDKMTMEEKINQILGQYDLKELTYHETIDALNALIKESDMRHAMEMAAVKSNQAQAITVAVAEEREKSITTGFKWGVNYLAKLIDESTLISELYGWKDIVDNCVERALNITKSNLDSLKGDKE